MSVVRAMVCICLFLPIAASSLLAQTSSTQNLRKSCRSFVQSFYDWYVPIALKGGYYAALQRRGSLLSPELLHALNEDYEAQKKVKDEVAGLDSDPFLNSQDPSEHFVVTNIALQGVTCMAEVRGVSHGRKAEYVRPELVLGHGRWTFVNFHYEQSEHASDNDLLSLLRSLRVERQKNPQ